MQLWRTVCRAAAVRRRSGPGIAAIGRDADIATLEDLQPLLYWGSDRLAIRFHIDATQVRLRGAYGLTHGWNPFAALLSDGEESLRCFYDRFAPTSLCSYYLLEDLTGETGARLSPKIVPWVAQDGVAYKQTTLFHGPGSATEVDSEIRRILDLHRSIEKSGYRPDLYGDVSGYFLKRGDQFRFFVKGGTHRAAVACALGLTRLPVILRPNWPRLIDIEDISNWPLVADGSVSTHLASAIFSRYFDFNGSQQRHAIFGD